MPRPPVSFVFCRFTGGRCDEATPGWLRSPPGWSKAVGAGGTEEAEEGQGVLRGCTGVHGCMCGAGVHRDECEHQ